MKKKKIAIIVQRYGRQVNGGAEVHARMIAEKLVSNYDITVLTSRALDYHTWEPELSAGESFEDGIKIIRFDHGVRDPEKTHLLNRFYRGRRWFQKLYRFLRKPKWYSKIFPEPNITEETGREWLASQGPAVYDLVSYVKDHAAEYDAYIFFTYLYFPTAVGMPPVGYKSIFIPTMHDEPPAYFPLYKKVMASPKRILFNTLSEQRFSEKMFPIADVSKAVVAVGIDPVDDKKNPEVPTKFNIRDKYVLYVGRIDHPKGCDELLKFFTTYLQHYPDKITLVLAGKNMMEPVMHPQIIYAGFVSDEEKEQLMKQAEALIIPSLYESLSLVLLESFACKTPVVVNEKCDVLKDHLEASKGGWGFHDYESFESALNELATTKDNRSFGLNGYRYVTANYSWDKVITAFDAAIEFVSLSNKESL